MKRYMGKRILFSIFSLLVVVATVMLLVFSLIKRSVIFQMDDTWNKKSSNDRSIYEYTMYSKYGYLDYTDYTTFLKNKYEPLYDSEYTKNADYKADKDAIQNENAYLENASVQEFIEQYEKKGYDINYLTPARSKSGKVKSGGNGYLIAVHEKRLYYPPLYCGNHPRRHRSRADGALYSRGKRPLQRLLCRGGVRHHA